MNCNGGAPRCLSRSSWPATLPGGCGASSSSCGTPFAGDDFGVDTVAQMQGGGTGVLRYGTSSSHSSMWSSGGVLRTVCCGRSASTSTNGDGSTPIGGSGAGAAAAAAALTPFATAGELRCCTAARLGAARGGSCASSRSSRSTSSMMCTGSTGMLLCMSSCSAASSLSAIMTDELSSQSAWSPRAAAAPPLRARSLSAAASAGRSGTLLGNPCGGEQVVAQQPSPVPHPLAGAAAHPMQLLQQQQQQLPCSPRRIGADGCTVTSRPAPGGTLGAGLGWVLPQYAGREVLAEYEFGRTLGCGTFGVTRLVTHRATAAPAACKTICKGAIAACPAAIADVRREVAILRHLSGAPGVVQLRGAYEDERSIHIVLELCAGGDLLDFVSAAGRLPEREAAHVAATMLDTLRRCHSRGVVHRDVKPENWLLAAPPCAIAKGGPGAAAAALRISDFGVSTFHMPGQRFSEIVGTPYYMAPEVLARCYGPAADVWSTGVVLYLLIGGLLPFDGSCDRAIIKAVLDAAPDFTAGGWEDASDDARSFVASMLVKDPTRRARADELLEHVWLKGTSAAVSAGQRTPCCCSTAARPSSCPGTGGTGGGQVTSQASGRSSCCGLLSPSATMLCNCCQEVPATAIGCGRPQLRLQQPERGLQLSGVTAAVAVTATAAAAHSAAPLPCLPAVRLGAHSGRR